uniref:DNA (cytosine-5-)-methyltransferase n=2 Tax=unclassified Caudoviricetes TaxID=2788787 RepID=A0A8S5VFG5_9CAUD|nr:MAG TPA: Cytosine specific methyltransferase [Siphoviridae sp. ctu1o13]DAG05422.1 MAG TPA: Cytosine specific methyltransferase [Siphoviridae sp. ct1da40]
MLHLGDITKINGAEAPVVDVVIGGSPCQDLSIAGKRTGLAGARSGLYMEQIRVVKEMREHDMASGRTGEFLRPRYMVWENVPGAFSSNGGKDFAAVLEEAIRVAEPEAPDIEVPEKGWNTWGGYHDEMGGRWSVAWRVLDAQHWGVPQRRRRIALVADFGGDTAWEILFEQQSVSGYPAESGAEGERPSAGAESGAACAVRIRGGCDGGGKGALVQTEKSGTLGTGNDQTIFQNCLTPWDCQSKRVYSEAGVMPTLPAGENSGQNQESVLCLNNQGGSMMGVSHDVSGTLRAQEHWHQPAVMAFDTTQITSKQNGSIPDFGKPCHTLNANAHVPCAILDMSHACDVIRDCGEVAPSLQARMGTGGNQIPLTYQKTTGTLSPGAHAGSYNGQDAYNDMLVCGAAVPDIAHTLKAKANCDFREDSETYPVQNRVVRRLTPLECERLQGFPDHWTDLGEWTDSKGKRHKDADSPRYKALGNSIALPPWKWLLKRLCGNYERDATMASLFDGIGGFPLIWEQLNGRGTCLWASEIEEFPIAVTKRRFGTVEKPGDMGRFLFPYGKDEL